MVAQAHRRQAPRQSVQASSFSIAALPRLRAFDRCLDRNPSPTALQSPHPKTRQLSPGEGRAVMKDYPTERIRNIVLLGHGSTGKTSLAEAALFVSGAINRLGKVEDGTTASDFDPDETKRHVSINASILPAEWKDHKINLIDSPGYADFIGDSVSGLAAVDTAVIVVCAASGVQVGTELAWEMADEAGKPRAILVNRLDRENANFETTLSQINAQLSRRAVAVQLPIGNQHSFSGVVDLIDGKAYSGEKATAGDAPGDMAAAIEAARGALLE